MSADPLLQSIHTEIPGVVAAAWGTADGAGFHAESWGGGTDLTTLRAEVLGLVRTWQSAYQHLGGPVEFGSNDELLVSASKGYLLIRVHHDRGRFVAVLLSASGNLGYLRFRLRDYLRTAAAA